MFLSLINEFRQINNREPARYLNKILDDYCLAHTLAMVNRNGIYHAPACYLDGYAEIVGCYDYLGNFEDTIRFFLSELGSKYPEHKKILLDIQEIGYGIMVHQGRLYITIRGR